MKLRGSFDRVVGAVAMGWVQDENQPNAPVTVDFFDGENLIGRVTAAEFRQDLQDQGVGDGFHGFEFVLPARLIDGKNHRLAFGTAGFRCPADGFAFSAELASGEHAVVLEGSELVMTLDGGMANATEFQLLEADRRLATQALTPDMDGRIRFSLPASVLDGRPHVFSLQSLTSPMVFGGIGVITPYVTAPDRVVRAESGKNIKGGLSVRAGARYESLRRSLNKVLAVHASTEAPLRSDLLQLLTAHEEVVRGFDGISTGGQHVMQFVAPAEPTVSVVMVVRNASDVACHAAASLRLAQNDAEFELIIVDDASSDESVKLEERIKGARILRNDSPQGYVRSCRIGASAAAGGFLVILGQNVEVNSGWLDELLWPFENLDRVGLTGAKLIGPDGYLKSSGGMVCGNGQAVEYGNKGNPADPRYNYTREVDYLPGGALALHKQVWDELGGFDEANFPDGLEDIDLAFRVRDKGLKAILEPRSEVTLFANAEFARAPDSEKEASEKAQAQVFKKRWVAKYRSHGVLGENVHLLGDRSCQARVLMLDGQVPRPDQDAGSYAAIQEMRLLQSLGCKVSFAAESLVHYGTYTDALQRMGVEVLYGPHVRSIEHLLLERGQEFDVVYITRYQVAANHLNSVRRHAPQAKVILNNADLHFLREIRAAIAANGNKELARQAIRTRKAELAVMKKVDLVLSYNEVEQAVIQSHNLQKTRTARCPWVVDAPPSVAEYDDRSGIAFLGGFGHPPNLEAVKFFVRDVMPLLRKQLPGVRFHVYGSMIPESIRELACDDIRIEGYVENVSEVYQSCRVFVAPLQSGAGIKGKVVAAFAQGVPTVLSPLAAEGTGARDGSEILVAESPKDWTRQIVRLYNEKSLWQSVSSAGRALAEDRYSFDQGRQLMRKALGEVEVYFPKVGETEH